MMMHGLTNPKFKIDIHCLILSVLSQEYRLFRSVLLTFKAAILRGTTIVYFGGSLGSMLESLELLIDCVLRV